MTDILKKLLAEYYSGVKIESEKNDTLTQSGSNSGLADRVERLMNFMTNEKPEDFDDHILVIWSSRETLDEKKNAKSSDSLFVVVGRL